MDKPILFSAPMVRAILDGRKTVTRRGLSKSNTFFNGMTWPKYVRIGDCNWQSAWVDAGPSPAGNPGPYLHVEWPYGKLCDGGTDEKLWARVYPRKQPGDLLWVREAWSPIGELSECTGPADIHYRATSTEAEAALCEWKPSIHMPRWACRLRLRVTAVKVERLQDISEEDAIAEGIIAMRSRAGSVPITVYGYDANAQNHSPSARDAFSFLWTSINGPGSWDVNPWVASYSFERVT
ncbi:MAG: hypothetical protein IPM06_22500 [Rhizobiales bacterium]|nr:hypothetical protein [Hyphomicrobiales bacterium]